MLKIVLIALGLDAALAFGTVPSTDDEVSLTTLVDVSWCAGGANWGVAGNILPGTTANAGGSHGFYVEIDFEGPEPERQCWEACEKASEASFAEDIYTVPTRDVDPMNRGRAWTLLNAAFCPICPSCECQSRCECVSGESADLIKRADDPMPSAFGPPVEKCCDQRYDQEIAYCAKTYDDGTPNAAFPSGRAPGYYDSFLGSYHCKHPNEDKSKVTTPFTPREVTENCKAREAPFPFTWSVGEVERCIQTDISSIPGVGDNPLPVNGVPSQNIPSLFSRVEPDQTDYVIMPGGAFYWKIQCDSEDRTLEAKVYWTMESCVGDDAAGSNSPAGACYGPSQLITGNPEDKCNLFPGPADAYQYGFNGESCGSPAGRRRTDEKVSFKGVPPDYRGLLPKFSGQK